MLMIHNVDVDIEDTACQEDTVFQKQPQRHNS